MIGKSLIGRYQIIQGLGAGAFGQTYIAEDLYHPGNPKCVVKHLRQGTSFDPNCLRSLRRRFTTEAETLRQLSHRQIPQLLASFEENQEFFLVQEFILGHQLTAELPTSSGIRRWTESQVIHLLQDVLRILEFVHSQGFIHCDLKPNNLVRRTADGRLFLIDFGAVQPVRPFRAKLSTPRTTSNDLLRTQLPNATGPELLYILDDLLGSQEWTSPEETAQLATGQPNDSLLPPSIEFPAHSHFQPQIIAPLGYIPAEQFTGQPHPSTDIYALSLVAIQMLTGLEPLRLKVDFNSGEVIWRHFVPELSAQLASVLSQMLRYHVKDRYQSATEALQALDGWGAVGSSLGMVGNGEERCEMGTEKIGISSTDVGQWEVGSDSSRRLKGDGEWRVAPPHPPICLPPLLTAVGICLAANSLVFTFGLYSLLDALPSEPTDSSRATPEHQLKEFKQAQLEVQAQQLLQQAYKQAERRNFRGAISSLKQIAPQTATGAKVHPKLVEYSRKQQIRANYLLQQAYNRAAVSDFTTALHYLKQIPTNTAAHGRAAVKITEYLHKQHFRAKVQQAVLPTGAALRHHQTATSTAFHPDGCLQEVNTNYSNPKLLVITL